MPTLTGTLQGHNDFELDLPRTHPVTYTAEVPEGPAGGLVFLIKGFGEDGQASYQEMLRRYISERYNLVAVTVDAHCHIARPVRAGGDTKDKKVSYEFDLDSLYAALGALALRGYPIDPNLKSRRSILSFLKKFLYEPLEIRAKMKPPWGEYQNFGVLAALDHLSALGHIIDQDIDFDRSNIVCIGTSHGGYVAQLIHKFAPNTISGVIEASSYTQAMKIFLGGGKEFTAKEQNLSIVLNTDTKWELYDVFHSNYLDRCREDIRNVAFARHLREIQETTERHCQFRMVHSEADRISPIAFKQRQQATLSSFGYDTVLDVLQEKDIDGKFVKSMEHGMGIAINELFDRYYPTLSVESTVIDLEKGTVLEFDCDDRVYRIEHLAHAPWIAASCPMKEIHSDKSSRIGADHALRVDA